MSLPPPNLRVPAALLDRAERLVPHIAARSPEFGSVSRAEVLREAIACGLALLERDAERIRAERGVA